FFGMILGDAGYGTVLIVLAWVLKKRYRKKQFIYDALRILRFCAAYAVFFGILYGEFFGDLGHRLFGLEPVCFERRIAVIPALVFALATGAAHLILGLSLGVVTALRKRSRREALFRLVSILAVLMVIVLVLSAFGLFPGALGRPVVLILLALTPLLFFTGGILAPLEFLKNLGNIVSYARIMAIGLTSVLLAFVANQIAGLTGDIVTGVIAAALLHFLNIILGVFAPAIHSLRLHYVEFFSKFLEHGGRRFEPLRR
ncbi:MAG: hypothetical protein K8F62_07420, partial [Pseudorhodoplanes sp.]|nr:hypothetical protein [Pseudorhodoplanes sp.]